jgi:non-specific serine/threonine protein kinase/serine/threonine-protein kinase
MPDHEPRPERPTLSSADFARIEAVFASLTAADPESRPHAIADSLPDRPDLQLELSELLQAHDRLAADADADVVAGAAPGEQVGAYRLVEKIGEGGMGEVYRAARADGLFTQQVAVKITRSTIANTELRRRFAMERQILASLNHDHIVRLLDGGTTGHGQAFVIMEYVEGDSLTRHCREGALSLEARLRLITAVCAAVQYAHQRGVVHRDLKPANILVTRDHIPKVLDFGVAKLLEQHSEPTGFTTTGIVPGPLTPNYASPEQMRGVAVTTATDVYALGVILYEVVAGVRPYETQGLPLDRVIELVLNKEPARPSAAAGGGDALPYSGRRLEGDIDAIVLKAMSKEPADRYGSASELAADITRWLDGHPVLARVPSAVYVLGRFARRHTRLVAASAVALTAILAASGVAVWQWQQARREQARAEQRFNDVRQLANAVIFKIHDQIRGLPGSTPVRRTLVNEAIGYLERLSAEAGDNASLRVEVALAQQQVAAILGEVGAANLGDREGAIKQFERAQATVMPLFASGSPFEVVKVVVDSDIRLSELHSTLGRHDESMRLAHQAVDRAKAYVARQPGDRRGEELQARTYFNLAVRVRDEDSIPIWIQTYDFYERLLVAKPDDVSAQRNVALVAKYLADTLFESPDKRAQAEQYYRRALELDGKRLAQYPDDQRVWFDAMISFSSMAGWAQYTGDRIVAAEMFYRSLELRRRLAQSDPENMQGVDRLGYLLMRIGRFHGDHEPDLALKFGKEAVALLSDKYQKLKWGSMLATLARAHHVIAAAETRLGQVDAGCRSFRRAGQLFAELGGREQDDDTYLEQATKTALAACAARGK